MNIPSIPGLPTDNLYKFLAVFGIILTITSIILVPYCFDKFGPNLIETKYKLNEIKYSINNFSSITDTTLKNRTLNNFEKELDDMEFYTKEMEVETKMYLYICCLTLATGIALSYLGFTLWFENVQVYQDLIILTQSGYKIEDWENEKEKIRKRVRKNLNKYYLFGFIFFLLMIIIFFLF
jgi:hypothetical protein